MNEKVGGAKKLEQDGGEEKGHQASPYSGMLNCEKKLLFVQNCSQGLK